MQYKFSFYNLTRLLDKELCLILNVRSKTLSIISYQNLSRIKMSDVTLLNEYNYFERNKILVETESLELEEVMATLELEEALLEDSCKQCVLLPICQVYKKKQLTQCVGLTLMLDCFLDALVEMLNG